MKAFPLVAWSQLKMSLQNWMTVIAILFVFVPSAPLGPVQAMTAANKRALEAELAPHRKRVEDMFYHAYDNYLNHAFPYDELRPLTCDGINTWGNFQVMYIGHFQIPFIHLNNLSLSKCHF